MPCQGAHMLFTRSVTPMSSRGGCQWEAQVPGVRPERGRPFPLSGRLAGTVPGSVPVGISTLVRPSVSSYARRLFAGLSLGISCSYPFYADFLTSSLRKSSL